jgi:hypothetical protein
MKLIALLTKYRPSDGFWVVVGLIALGLTVALPAAAWTGLEHAAFGRP